MALPTIDGLCRYGLIDPAGHEVELNLMLDAAEQWYAGCGVPESAKGSAQYELAVYMLALHYYDQRGAVAEGNIRELPLGVMSMLNQLRF